MLYSTVCIFNKGQEKEVSNKHRREMPYVDAILLETLRIGNIAAFGLPHTLDVDMEIEGQVRMHTIQLFSRCSLNIWILNS